MVLYSLSLEAEEMPHYVAKNQPGNEYGRHLVWSVFAFFIAGCFLGVVNAQKINLGKAASAASNTVQTLSESQLGELANAMLGASHSRKQESDADEYAYSFMKQHGYNVVAAYTAFKKLALLSSGSSGISGFEKMLNSHPDSDRRAEAVKKKARQDGLWQDPGTVELPKTKLN